MKRNRNRSNKHSAIWPSHTLFPVLKRSKNIIFLLSFFILGILVRTLSGNAPISPNLVYSPGIREKIPGTRTPEAAVKSFFLSIDSGDFETAWELLLEPDWTEPGVSVLYRDSVSRDFAHLYGWTEKEDFVKRSKSELGVRGTGVTLNNIEARIKCTLDPKKLSEDYSLDSVKEAYIVEVSGNILGACSIFRWQKELHVLLVGKRYKVLLSGTKPENSFYYQSWFASIERVGDLKGAAK